MLRKWRMEYYVEYVEGIIVLAVLAMLILTLIWEIVQ